MKLRRAIEQALEYGCTDPEAVRCLLSAARLKRAEPERLILELPYAERALPTMTAYDQLLGQETLQGRRRRAWRAKPSNSIASCCDYRRWAGSFRRWLSKRRVRSALIPAIWKPCSARRCRIGTVGRSSGG